MSFLYQYSLTEIQPITTKRPSEIKLGECITDDWKKRKVQFVLLGTEESIGGELNFGTKGTETAFGKLNFENYFEKSSSVI